MPVDEDIKKVLIIGSGPIQIGQAAEFDYSGSQACKSLREEGLETVLVNSNPATIQTDMDMADTVYTEPLTAELVAQIIEKAGAKAICVHPRTRSQGYSGKADWSIIKHESVNYPIPYFKTEADCRKAFLYLKRLGKLDALYSDL